MKTSKRKDETRMFLDWKSQKITKEKSDAKKINEKKNEYTKDELWKYF